jgi:replicative DNA helicase Mcm
MDGRATSFEDGILERFEEFVEKNARDDLAKAINTGQQSFYIDYSTLDKFDPELTDFVTENPDRGLELFSRALQRIDIAEDTKLNIRFNNISDNKKIKIRDIRSRHIGKMNAIEGLIRQASDVRPVATLAVFECPMCGTQIELAQSEQTIKEPSICSCGKKGRFKLISKKLVDTQRIVIEESPENLATDAQPRRLSIFLTEDLVEPKIEKRTSPGTKIRILGVVREIPIIDHGAKTTRYDLIMHANNIEPLEQEFEELDITPEDVKIIKEMSNDPEVTNRFVRSIAPSIFGYEAIKEAIVFQLFGGIKTTRPDKTVIRGDIHVLLVGDPGVAKSQLLKYVSSVAPKARYVSGKGASGAGITATVVKDEFLRGWSLEAGALVLANKGIACIDEIDKMDKEDRSAMHEAMEQQTVTIAKANIHSTLRSETTILAAANPKLGRFDPYQTIGAQIDMPPTLISRFDLIFPIRDLPNKERDEKLADHILGAFVRPEDVIPEVSPDLMRKYIAYAKRYCKPQLTKEAITEIKEFFVGLRTSKTSFGEETLKPIPISARQLEALIRLAQASARIRLNPTVTKNDAKEAIKLLKNCLQQVGIDTETGELDIDRIVTGITTSQRNKIFTIRDIINELGDRFGANIPIADVIDAAKLRGIEETKIEEILEKMRRDGEIFEPKHGIIRKM